MTYPLGRSFLPTVLALAVAASACDSDSRNSSVMAREVDKICHAVELSGAPRDGTTNDLGMTALWLGQNIKSDEGLAFLRAFAKLGDDKAARRKMLTDAAATYGIKDCPLVSFWE
ncbi:MAG TPA: hypothetical protein VHE35_06590 [Kofleriaceae bacterium]|nr:hypothetical protein [Kofleriaceae bacterium]